MLTAEEHVWSANMELLMKVQALRESSMTEIMIELKKTAAADDKMVKDLMWLLSDTQLLLFGLNLHEPIQFAGHIQRMIKLGLISMAIMMSWMTTRTFGCLRK